MQEAIHILTVRGVHWLDVVDVLAVALLLFFVLRQVRGTRAVQMIIGVFVLVVANALAGWIGLTATHRVLQNLLFYVPFAIIVLFQDPIRKVLASTGSAFFGRKTVLGITERVAREASHACFSLVQQRQGALILFERTQGLKDFIETGVKINADISRALLVTIFYPGTPIHDGAVIIVEGVIKAANCLLPISSSPLPAEFGTRHRAAVGATEQTDAFCIVVSEERGEVSVVVEGVIQRVSSIDELAARITRLMGGKAVEG